MAWIFSSYSSFPVGGAAAAVVIRREQREVADPDGAEQRARWRDQTFPQGALVDRGAQTPQVRGPATAEVVAGSGVLARVDDDDVAVAARLPVPRLEGGEVLGRLVAEGREARERLARVEDEDPRRAARAGQLEGRRAGDRVRELPDEGCGLPRADGVVEAEFHGFYDRVRQVRYHGREFWG